MSVSTVNLYVCRSKSLDMKSVGLERSGGLREWCKIRLGGFTWAAALVPSLCGYGDICLFDERVSSQQSRGFVCKMENVWKTPYIMTKTLET